MATAMLWLMAMDNPCGKKNAQQQQLIKDARLEVERGNYSNITEALNTDPKFVEQWELLQTELGDLFTKRDNSFTESALIRAQLRKDS